MHHTRVLLVSGDRAVAEVTAEHLRNAGCEVVECRGESEVDRAPASQAFDLLVLDLAVGGDKFRLIRERRRGSSIPILLLADGGPSLDRLRGLSAGADDYVLKPVRGADLVARAHGLIARRAADRARASGDHL